MPEFQDALHRVPREQSAGRWRSCYRLLAALLLIAGFVAFFLHHYHSTGELIPWRAPTATPTETPTPTPTPTLTSTPTASPTPKPLRLGAPVFIRIFKTKGTKKGELELWMHDDAGQFELMRTYPICALSGHPGPKVAEGDLQVPEGFYFVDRGQLNPNSIFHLAFNIGYPNEYDRRHGRTGSAIMVHGGCASIGCLAMTDDVMDELYRAVDAALDAGQPFFHVHVFPFRMNEETMREHTPRRWRRDPDFWCNLADNENHQFFADPDPYWPVNPDWFDVPSFWCDLKEGYDFFEQEGYPPDVSVVEGRYRYKLRNLP